MPVNYLGRIIHVDIMLGLRGIIQQWDRMFALAFKLVMNSKISPKLMELKCKR